MSGRVNLFTQAARSWIGYIHTRGGTPSIRLPLSSHGIQGKEMLGDVGLARGNGDVESRSQFYVF